MSVAAKFGLGTGAACGIAIAVWLVHPAALQTPTAITTAASSTVATASSRPSPSSAANAPAKPTPKPAANPTWTSPGSPQCAITYNSDANGGTTWTATTTVAGEIKTDDTNNWPGDHVAPSFGLDTLDVQVPVGQTPFSTDAPLNTVTDISGVLYVPDVANATTSYGCSVAPAAKGTGNGSFAATTGIGEIMAPSGRYYNAGGNCPAVDAGRSTVTDQGRTITCMLGAGRHHWRY